MNASSSTSQITPDDVISFWQTVGPDMWFEKSDALDAEITDRFAAARDLAAAGKLDDWTSSAQGALALILLIDQFSRNIFRDSAKAYEADPLALQLAEFAIQNGFDEKYAGNPLRRFFYLPFMHAESQAAQQRCIDLHKNTNDVNGIKFAELHADIIFKFGRFPHRNNILGRATTPAEEKFLRDGGFAG